MMQFDPGLIITSLPKLLPYVLVTLAVTVLSALSGTGFGILLAIAKKGKNRFAKLFANGYTAVMRCTPSVVLLFVVFYGLPKFSLEVLHKDIDDINKGVFVVITLTLLFAATMSEVIRGAWDSIPKGQYEAAVCAGLSTYRVYTRILIPQICYIALPNFGNAIIALVKEGALAFTIGFIDLIGKANLMVSLNLGAHSREIYLSAAVIYWFLSLILEQTLLKVEQHAGRGRTA